MYTQTFTYSIPHFLPFYLQKSLKISFNKIMEQNPNPPPPKTNTSVPICFFAQYESYMNLLDTQNPPQITFQ